MTNADDGGLRPLFRNKFSSWQWTSVETAGSASGVPDSEFCTPTGTQGWIEFKQTHIFAVKIKPLQVAWLRQRCRYGGNAWIAVRRHKTIHNDLDELWLMSGIQADRLKEDGLRNVLAVSWGGGPSRWDYAEIREILTAGVHIMEKL
jgi:hypothetical protein